MLSSGLETFVGLSSILLNLQFVNKAAPIPAIPDNILLPDISYTSLTINNIHEGYFFFDIYYYSTIIDKFKEYRLLSTNTTNF